MRRSPKRHPLAILRLTLGLTQKEVAQLAGCTAVTIKRIEAGKLALSGRLAEHISAITGVSEDWLVAGDPTEAIVAEDGSACMRKHFEERQAILFDRKISKKRKVFEQEFTPEVLALALLKVYSIVRKGTQRIGLPGRSTKYRPRWRRWRGRWEATKVSMWRMQRRVQH